MNKKAIVVTSFGTSYIEVLRRSIEVLENQIAREFADFEIRRAFTSGMVRSSLEKKEGIKTKSLEEVLEDLREEGYSEVYIQPLHIIPGEEYNEKIVNPAKEFTKDFSILKTGKPLLYATEDYFKAIEALREQIGELDEKTAVLLMGHGATHPANSSYAALQYKLYDEMPHVYLANIEGYPELDDVIDKVSSYENLILMPFMLVAGDHAINDMAGDEEDSWKSILTEKGFNVEIYLKGLGENPAIRQIFVDYVHEMLGQ